jgi:FMN phosphatase YigB (HAD superfamily)
MDLMELSEVRGILFDLDGTLLNVEMNAFVFGYVESLSRSFTDLVNHRDFAKALLGSAFEMLHSDDGSQTNEVFFLDKMSRRLDIAPGLFKDRLEGFYRDGLHELAPLVRPFPISRRILRHCFDHDLIVVIATNPVFPRQVIDARINWGCLEGFPFHLVTSYENSRFCKPHRQFFQDILDSQGLRPEESLMVGNDAEFDLPARQAGIPTFLLDTCPPGPKSQSRRADFRGSHQDLLQLLEHITRNRIH